MERREASADTDKSDVENDAGKDKPLVEGGSLTNDRLKEMISSNPTISKRRIDDMARRMTISVTTHEDGGGGAPRPHATMESNLPAVPETPSKCSEVSAVEDINIDM